MSRMVTEAEYEKIMREDEELMRKYTEAHGCGAEAQRQCGMVKAPDEKRPSPCYECVPAFPMPCVRDEHGKISTQTIKSLFMKINEELDELKEAVIMASGGLPEPVHVAPETRGGFNVKIAEEAADTITAITTMLEALGIDATMRDEAQRRVNSRNRERGRL